jgi:hypothetical protein
MATIWQYDANQMSSNHRATQGESVAVLNTLVNGLDEFVHQIYQLLRGNEVQRSDDLSPTPSSLMIEALVSVLDTFNPRIRMNIVDMRLATIIIKNAAGSNVETNLRLNSTIHAPVSTQSTERRRIAVNRYVCLTQLLNDTSFPHVYQYGFCVKSIDTLVKERLPWVAGVYGKIVPRAYSKPTLSTLFGGAFEIAGYAPTAYSSNEKRSSLSHVVNHIRNFQGITLTMRKSDEDDILNLIQTWCKRETELRPGVCYSWRSSTWMIQSGYVRNELCQSVLHCTDLFRTLLRDANRMNSSNVQSCMCCMLYGPPGTGKTRTVFELAHCIGYSLYTTSFIHNPSSNLKHEREPISLQLDDLANLTSPFVLLVDDIEIDHGVFVNCTLSRAELLSFLDCQSFPSKSIVILVSNHVDWLEMSEMYDGAMCRNGRVKLIESKLLRDVENRRIRRILHKTKYRRVNLHPITRICDLFDQMRKKE